MKRVLKWAVVNGLFGWCVWAGVHEGVAGAANLAMLYAWIGFVVALFTLSDKVVEGLAESVAKSRIPVWLDVIVDLSAVALFVWHGWWWTGIAYLLHCLFMADLRRKSRLVLEKK